MKFIIGKKLDMTQVWRNDEVVAVTKIQAGPCAVVQVKDKDKDGYEAIQIGYGEKKEKNIRKPQKKHMKGLGNFRYLREFRIMPQNTKDANERQDVSLKRGDKIDVSAFEAGDIVKVTGVSKGRGFQGVVKRHGFKGMPASHGTKDQLRMPGSIGATGPAKVFKGKKMPGRMGSDRTTVSNLEIIKVDKENNILLVKGAVPGARNGLVLVSGEGEMKLEVGSEKSEKKEENEQKVTIEKSKSDEVKSDKPEKKSEEEEKIEKEQTTDEKDDKTRETPQENIEKVVVEADKERKKEAVVKKDLSAQAGEKKEKKVNR